MITKNDCLTILVSLEDLPFKLKAIILARTLSPSSKVLLDSLPNNAPLLES